MNCPLSSPRTSEWSYNEYFDEVKGYNRYFHKVLPALLDYDNLEHCALVITGSDGRLEKGLGSKMEFILILNQKRPHPRFTKNIIRNINMVLGKMNDSAEQFIESKDLNSDILNYYIGDDMRVFPMRILDAVFLNGNAAHLATARYNVLSEFVGPEGKYIFDRVCAKRREYGKTALHGIQRYKKDQTVTHLDFNDGIAYFDPECWQYSFKFGPLRYLQFALMQETVRLVRRNPEPSIISTIAKSPTNIQDRIEYYSEHDMLNISRATVSELSDIYKYFVWSYNRTQELYYISNITRSSFDAPESKRRIAALDAIISGKFFK